MHGQPQWENQITMCRLSSAESLAYGVTVGSVTRRRNEHWRRTKTARWGNVFRVSGRTTGRKQRILLRTNVPVGSLYETTSQRFCDAQRP